MPKAAVNKNYLPLRRKDEIRFAGQFRPVKTIPISQTVYEMTDPQLWLRVLRADEAHLGAAFFRRQIVHASLVTNSEIIAKLARFGTTTSLEATIRSWLRNDNVEIRKATER
jgi:hypothetical protein